MSSVNFILWLGKEGSDASQENQVQQAMTNCHRVFRFKRTPYSTVQTQNDISEEGTLMVQVDWLQPWPQGGLGATGS